MLFLSFRILWRGAVKFLIDATIPNNINAAVMAYIMGVVACTCNPPTLYAEFWNGVGSKPVMGNSPFIGGWIMWPPVVLNKERNPTKDWDLSETLTGDLNLTEDLTQ